MPIFCHLLESKRPSLYESIKQGLKPSGVLLLESYNKKHLSLNTGGPKDIGRLLSLQELQDAFSSFEILAARDMEKEIQEGIYHTGVGSMTQFIARKPL